VDVDGHAEIVDDLVERPKSGIFVLAVDVGSLDVEDLSPKSFRDELRDARLAGAAGSGDDGRVGGFTVRGGARGR
jgi:hypothetical protein